MKHETAKAVKLWMALLVAVACALGAASALAKPKEVVKADDSYDWKGVQKIVILPITSDGVDFGKVDPERMPKIQAILEKVKDKLRKQMVEGAKQAKVTIPFAYTADKKPTTLVMKYNIEKFDNGNQAARLVPFAGKAQVDLRCQMTSGADPKKVLVELTASGKQKGGIIPGGTDAETLWAATHMANNDIYMFLKKRTGFDYSFWSGLGEGMKMGTKDQVDIMKEEKKEKGIMEKKTKK
jgi:hypothetical protein